jgi:hypothetical protein
MVDNYSKIQKLGAVQDSTVGGVSHCSLHCRLAKFRGLMRRCKYGAVIGQKTRFSYVPNMNYQAMGSF